MPEGVQAEVVAGIPRSNGDKTFRAEVDVPRGNESRGGKVQIRGPNRSDRGSCEQDIKAFVKAFEDEGASGGRKVQRELQRGWIN